MNKKIIGFYNPLMLGVYDDMKNILRHYQEVTPNSLPFELRPLSVEFNNPFQLEQPHIVLVEESEEIVHDHMTMQTIITKKLKDKFVFYRANKVCSMLENLKKWSVKSE